MQYNIDKCVHYHSIWNLKVPTLNGQFIILLKYYFEPTSYVITKVNNTLSRITKSMMTHYCK